jgi:hypothetical protein
MKPTFNFHTNRVSTWDQIAPLSCLSFRLEMRVTDLLQKGIGIEKGFALQIHGRDLSAPKEGAVYFYRIEFTDLITDVAPYAF